MADTLTKILDLQYDINKDIDNLVDLKEEIAQVIAPQFEETGLETITTIVRRYYEQDTWKSNLIFEQDSFDLLQNILDSAGELKERAPYEDLVTTTFAEEAIR